MKKLVLAIAFMGMGSFVMAQQTPSQDKDREAKRAEMQQKRQQKQQEHLAQMQKDLNLNQSQVSQIKALHEKRDAEMKAEFEQNKAKRQADMDKMKQKREQMDADMKKILSTEQYNKWQADRKSKMEQKKGDMKGKGGKGMKKQMQGTSSEQTK
ncbi:hypothetical protein [Chryseobacterium sp.]|uniref:hypothetical protein n=1 Tax=Chryseobacterium sp. TaxID=1871047 RepID=UPI0025BD0E04|nr:hypothetical protein [Chryseobacterium sp.]